MAEECKCIMLNEFKHITEDMTDRKNNERDMQKNISDIRTSQEKTMFVVEQVQKTQDIQTVIAKENQVEVARVNKEYKVTMDAGFKAIEDRRIADEKATLLEKKEIDKEKAAAAREKKNGNKALYIAIFLMAANFIVGALVNYIPTLLQFTADK